MELKSNDANIRASLFCAITDVDKLGYLSVPAGQDPNPDNSTVPLINKELAMQWLKTATRTYNDTDEI